MPSMPSPIRQVFKVSGKTFFNPAGWLDLDNVADQNKSLFGILKNIFLMPATGRRESFQEAMTRLGVNEADLPKIQNNYRFYALLFVTLGIALIIYSFYLLIHHGTI